MRIAIVDDILERHVARSLAEALRARGHAVLETGKRSHGPGPTRDPGEQALLAGAMRSVERFEPDVVLLMRPQSWPVEYSRVLRHGGARIAAWLSDDPVLLASGYQHVLESVDLLLHCGGEGVIAHYDALGLSAPGANFPFWTGTRAPRRPHAAPRHRGLFLGHLHGRVRAHRRELLESLDPQPVIYGKLDPGAESVAWRGELRADAEIERAVADAAIGLSLPQQFAAYRGTELDFDGLSALGGFETPSRVVQYAAMGLGVLTLDPSGASAAPSAFQAQIVTRSVEEFRQRYAQLDADEMRMLGADAAAEFAAHFSADRRAALLESLLLDDSWRAGTAAERAELYRGFAAPASASRGRALRRRSLLDRRAPLRDVALLGTGWQDPDSHLRAVQASLADAGFRVHELNPYALADRLVPDPLGSFGSLLDARPADPVLRCGALVLVGSDLGMTPAMWSALAHRGVHVAVAYDDAGWGSPRRSRLSARAHVATTVRRDVADALARLDIAERARVRLRVTPSGTDGPSGPEVAAITAGAPEVHGVLAAEAGAVPRCAVIDPALAASPGRAMRELRRLRRLGVSLLLPVEVLREIDVDLGASDATFASRPELEQKLRELAGRDGPPPTRTTMSDGVLRDRASGAELAALLAAID